MLTVDEMFNTLSKAEEAWGQTFQSTIPWTDKVGKPCTIRLTDLTVDAGYILARRSSIYVLALASRLEHLHRYQNPNIAVGVFAIGSSYDPKLLERTGKKLSAQLRSISYADKFCFCWHNLMAPTPDKRDLIMQDLMRAALARMLDDVTARNIPINWPADKDIYNECVPDMMSAETFLKAAISWANSRPIRERGNALINLNGMERHVPESLSPIAAQYKSALQKASGDVLQPPFPKATETANAAAQSQSALNPKIAEQQPSPPQKKTPQQPPNFGNKPKSAMPPGIIQAKGGKGQLRGGL